jgi:hypothetical protein
MENQVEEITKIEEQLKDLYKTLANERKEWNDILEKLTKKLKCELKELTDLEAEVIYYRQLVVDLIASYSFRIYREMPKMKQMRKQQFEYFSTKYQIKVNGTEKSKLIEATMALYDNKIEIIEGQIEFFRETAKNLQSLTYSCKNKIEIYNITGLE